MALRFSYEKIAALPPGQCVSSETSIYLQAGHHQSWLLPQHLAP